MPNKAKLKCTTLSFFYLKTIVNTQTTYTQLKPSIYLKYTFENTKFKY